MISSAAFIVLISVLVNIPNGQALILEQCRELDLDLRFYCPTTRYCAWEGFPSSTKRYLYQELEFDKDEWNYNAISPLEQYNFDDLDHEIQENFMDLGYDEDTHDCCLSHYEEYEWEEFFDEDYEEILATFELMGYEEDMWTNSIPSDYDDYYWDDLPRDIQYAMVENLCYNGELWDMVPLPMWTDDVALPGAYYYDEDREEEDYNRKLQLFGGGGFNGGGMGGGSGGTGGGAGGMGGGGGGILGGERPEVGNGGVLNAILNEVNNTVSALPPLENPLIDDDNTKPETAQEDEIFDQVEDFVNGIIGDDNTKPETVTEDEIKDQVEELVEDLVNEVKDDEIIDQVGDLVNEVKDDEIIGQVGDFVNEINGTIANVNVLLSDLNQTDFNQTALLNASRPEFNQTFFTEFVNDTFSNFDQDATFNASAAFAGINNTASNVNDLVVDNLPQKDEVNAALDAFNETFGETVFDAVNTTLELAPENVSTAVITTLSCRQQCGKACQVHESPKDGRKCFQQCAQSCFGI